MSTDLRFRDIFRDWTPPWLLDRLIDKLTVGYSYLWSMIAPLDDAAEELIQGLQAPWPGLGTPTALSLVGASRGMIRGQGESADSYAKRLLTWRTRAKRLGSAEQIASDLQNYLSTHPMVRVVNRAGFWTTLATDGTFSYTTKAWHWDDVSNPERNDPDLPFWSDQWIIIYSPPWVVAGDIGVDWGPIGRQTGIGHLVSRNEYDTVKALISETKAAHSNIRCVIWSYDDTKFNPLDDTSTMPDGTWGRWAYGDVRTARRDPTCRYWEPSQLVDPEP